MTDEQLQDIRTKLDTYDQVGTELNARKLELNRSLPRLQSRIEKEAGGGGESPKVKVDIIPAGSLAELEKQISAARKNFLNATTDEARAAADLLIKDLESRKAILEIQFKYKDLKNIEAGSSLATADPLSPLKGVKHTDMSGVIQVPKEAKSYTAYLNDVAEQNRDLMETVYGVSDALYGMSDILGESAENGCSGAQTSFHGRQIHTGADGTCERQRIRGGIRRRGCSGGHPHCRSGSRGRSRSLDHGRANEHSEVRVRRDCSG